MARQVFSCVEANLVRLRRTHDLDAQGTGHCLRKCCGTVGLGLIVPRENHLHTHILRGNLVPPTRLTRQIKVATALFCFHGELTRAARANPNAATVF